MGQGYLKKLVLLGTTGSGKTTFLKNLLGVMDEEFDGAEVPRNVELEKSQMENTFSPMFDQDYINSTTTVSMNVKGILFLITKTNEFEYYPLEKDKLPRDNSEIDCLFPVVIFDPAGQERLSFMQDISLEGADGVFIFADGSNIQSVERISQFLNMVHEEEEKRNKKIEYTVFVNKKDLESKGIYVGASSVERWLTGVEITETTNYNMDTFMLPIRNFLTRMEDFPITIEKMKEIDIEAKSRIKSQ